MILQFVTFDFIYYQKYAADPYLPSNCRATSQAHSTKGEANNSARIIWVPHVNVSGRLTNRFFPEKCPWTFL